MDIKKIGGFDEGELELLGNAGKLLGDVARNLDSGAVDKLDEEAVALIAALSDVIDRIKTFC